MAVTTSYPGVYLSEVASLNYSVTTSATAIPVFAFVRRASLPQGGNIQIFNNWNEFVSSHPEDNAGYNYYKSLKLWFMNGGGRCYLVNTNNLIEAVEKHDDITLVVAAGEDISSQFNALVNAGYRLFGLFDGPQSNISESNAAVVMANYPSTPYGAAFYPAVKVEWSDSTVPPGVVAAIAIARTDRTRGAWKAPSNVAIDGVAPNYPVSDDLQGRFNQGKALNMIRTFPESGTVLWGARTLEDSDNWRYIPVRRLFNMVERDIQKALNKLVFEPNSQPTWQRVKAAVDNYLYRLWRQGALVGDKESDAWFVEIGKDITMTDDQINNGEMNIKIGLAAVRPAEFILLQFSQNITQ